MAAGGNGGVPLPDGTVTIREVYALINQMRAEIKSEMSTTHAAMQNERAELRAEVQVITTMVEKKFDDHETAHEKEDAHIKSLIRWAVTTVMSAAGVAVAIYVAFKGGV